MSSPEIVLGASLLTLFLSMSVPLGFDTILIAHIMFSISYVVVTVKARLIGFDRHLEEAAMDLGANEWTTFRKVTPPADRAGRARGRPPRLRALRRRLRDHQLQRRDDGHVPALRLGAARVGAPPQVNEIDSAIFIIALSVMIVNVIVQTRRRPTVQPA
jgi:spermidine/putrescine transport system permease protein